MNKESVIKYKMSLNNKCLDEKWDCYGDSSFFYCAKKNFNKATNDCT